MNFEKKRLRRLQHFYFEKKKQSKKTKVQSDMMKHETFAKIVRNVK